jgi:hypothetical protein
MNKQSNRRTFLKSGAAVAGAIAAGPLAIAARANEAPPRSRSRAAKPKRLDDAYRIRVEAAERQLGKSLPSLTTNGDEARYTNKIASFSKGLRHDSLGEVDMDGYDALVGALHGGKLADYDAIPLGGIVRLVNPQAAMAFEMEGGDPQGFSLAPPPAFDSSEQAAEACELYWQALTRDVPFAEYATHPLIERAASDLSRFESLRAPRENARVTWRTLFRGNSPGDRVGPYVSQFLLKEMPFGAIRVEQRVRTATPGLDYLTTYDDWLAVQNGAATSPRHGSVYRYIRCGRDLAAYVNLDFSYQAFQTACLILFGMQGTTDAQRAYKGAPYNARNPYRKSRSQTGFVTFGGAQALDLVARVSSAALKACWYQKWCVHRRLRPEEFGGRVHNHRTGRANYPIDPSLLHSPVLEMTATATGTYLLPQAYPEGCPIHPSYPAGHSAVAGACATVLKACFDEKFPVHDPVEPVVDGLSLMPYEGQLTVGGEIDKLAFNVAMGRNTAGIHWRSDAAEGIRFGEAVALSVLSDLKECFHEDFAGFSLTKFDGTTIEI